MASGIVHDRASKWVAIAAGSFVGISGGSFWAIAEVASVTTLTTWMWGLYLSPDLDLAESKWGCRAKHRWGLLAAYWVPYGKMFKHRGVSHWLIVGTATRMAYGLWPLLWWCWGNSYMDVAVFVFTCGCVSDGMHLILDYWR